MVIMILFFHDAAFRNAEFLCCPRNPTYGPSEVTKSTAQFQGTGTALRDRAEPTRECAVNGTDGFLAWYEAIMEIDYAADGTAAKK